MSHVPPEDQLIRATNAPPQIPVVLPPPDDVPPQPPQLVAANPPQPAVATRWQKTRAIFAIIAVLTVCTEIAYAVSELIPVYFAVEQRDWDLGDLEYDAVTKFAVDVRIDQTKSLFTYAVIMLGALWSMLLVKADSPAIGGKDWQEITIFLAANVAVLIHVFTYSYYMYLVSGLTAAGAKVQRITGETPSIPDIFDRRINSFAIFQQFSIIAIAIMVGVLLFSVHKLKGAKT